MPADKLTQLGNFISRVGFPAFLIMFVLYYIAPILNRVAEGHLEYLRKTAETSAETRADIGKLIEVNTANRAVATETNRILQETSRQHTEVLRRIETSLNLHATGPAAPPAENPE